MKRRRKKAWLYEQYKLEHPDAFPQKSRKEIPCAVQKLFFAVMLFIVFNGLAIIIAAVLSTDVRGFFF